MIIAGEAAEAVEHCHRHHWYEWVQWFVNEFCVPIIGALAVLAGIWFQVNRKRKGK